MLQIFAISIQGEASPEIVKGWFQVARRAALEVSGVYDLALYRAEVLPEDQFWCALDAEDEMSLNALWDFSEMRAALRLGERFGLKLVKQSSSTRLV